METKPPTLEVISNRTARVAAALEQDSREKRRLPRLNLTNEHFRLDANGKIFSVADLSIEGMALRVLDRNDFVLFPVAMELTGTLNLHGAKYTVEAKVRHLGADIVGCEFHALSSEVRQALDRFLDPRELGRELRPIPASDASTLWYHGPTGTDLLLWRGVDGQYHRLTLYVRGSFIQWEEDDGLSTGTTTHSNLQAEIRGVVRYETHLMQRDPTPAMDKLKIAKELLLSSNLPQDLKKWCLRHFEART